MFETTIRLTRESDVTRLLKWFAQSCRAAGMHSDQIEEAVDRLGEAMRELRDRGRELGRNGHFTETRRIATKAFAVTLVADFGSKRGLLGRLLDALRGKGRRDERSDRPARARRRNPSSPRGRT
jgi:hypothetical protein